VRDSQPNLSSAHAESLVAVVDRDTLVGPAPDSPPLRRPALALSILLDAGLAACAYVAASWLRFPADRLGQFLPKVWSTLPYVVSGQLAMLIALGGYARRPRTDWLLRVAAGVVVGTAASSIALGITIGFEGISRSAFVADAVLLSIATIGWRGMWVLRSRARGRTPVQARIGELVDRAEEMATLGAVVMSLYAYRELLRNLVIKDLKLKYRGSVFGFLWSLANPLLMIVVYTVAFTYIMRVQTDNFVFYLMLGILSWTFFANSATMSTGAIVDNAGLLKSVSLPRAIFPIGLPACHGFVVPRAAHSNDVAVSRVSCFTGRFHDRHCAYPRHGHGVLPRRATPARSGPVRVVLDHADRLRVESRTRRATVSVPFEPHVTVHRRVSEAVLLSCVA